MTTKQACNYLLLIQVVLFFLASATGIVALFFGELLPFTACLLCDTMICRNVIILDKYIPRSRASREDRTRNR